MSPGPIIVKTPLSLNPSMKYKAIRFHFLWQNTPNIFTTMSITIIRRRVNLKPFLSPTYPQNGAPNMAEMVRMTEQNAKKWSSLMIGMKINFMYNDMKIIYRGTKYEMKNRMMNFLSLKVTPSSFFGFYLVYYLLLCDNCNQVVAYLTSQISRGGDSYFNQIVRLFQSSFFSINVEPNKKQSPLHTNITLEALNILSEIYFLKKAFLFQSISASQFFGLVKFKKIIFQMIMPKEKNSTAKPDTLFK